MSPWSIKGGPRLFILATKSLNQRNPRIQSVNLTSTSARAFHRSCSLTTIKPFLLADIGEGIREVQVIQWFVQEGARVEQFDKLCEVSSDKATVEITSRFDGVIKKLYYEADDMAIVGKPLVDIDIQSEISPEDEAFTGSAAEQDQASRQSVIEAEESNNTISRHEQPSAASQEPIPSHSTAKSITGRHSTLATPAVRHLTKELGVDISDVRGTGKDGRVLKEDVQRFATSRKATANTTSAASPSSHSPLTVTDDRVVPLTPTQNVMFKTMTASLSIPHFLYSDTIDLTALTSLRGSINTTKPPPSNKLSLLPFLVKAVSLALLQHPILNARTDTTTNAAKPHLVYRATHNIGVAVDTPTGLLVPVIRNVQDLSITDIAAEIKRLAAVARDGRLGPKDSSGATFNVSNVGSIGGMTVAPIISEGQLGIVGVGRSRVVPGFDAEGRVVPREECVLSWSADHRVVDGATVARCAEVVKRLLEGPGAMLVRLR